MHLSVEMVSSITLDPYSIIKSLMEASFTYLKIGLPPRLTELLVGRRPSSERIGHGVGASGRVVDQAKVP
jgi:hypothetical protein